MPDGSKPSSAPDRTRSAPRPAWVTLRTVLLAFSAFILLLSIGGMVVSGQWLGRKEAERAARERMQEVADRTAEQVADLLERAARTVEYTRQMAETGIVTFGDHRFTARYFLAMVARDPIIEGIYVTERDGGFTFATRDPRSRERFIAKEILRTAGGQTATYYFYDENLKQSDDAWLVRDEFLATSRPWYRLAMSGRLGWTDPYVFWTTGQIGISTARPVLCIDGKDGCAIGADFTLVGLSEFLAKQYAGPNAVSAILTPDGNVLAHSDLALAEHPPSAHNHRRGLVAPVSFDAYGDTRMIAAVRALAQPLAQIAERPLSYVGFTEDGVDYIGAFRPFRAGDFTWIVAAIAPSDNFVGWYSRLRQYELAMAVVLFVALTSVCIISYRSLSRALSRLHWNADAVAGGRFGEMTPPQSALVDVRRLEVAMADMASKIQREQRTTRDAMSEAIEASQAKSNFLAHMSHEFRTPLNAIVGFSEYLALLTQDKLSGREASYLRDVLDAARHLGRLINDTLDLAQIESGRLVLRTERCSLRTIIERATHFSLPQATARGIQIRVLDGDDQWAEVDQQRLTQAILNITINAVKYSGDGSLVEISTRCGAETFDVRIEDHGIGMSEDETRRALEPFGRIVQNVHVAQQGGVGLGLTITRAVMEAHGGSLHIESRPGVGTVAILRLPRSVLRP